MKTPLGHLSYCSNIHAGESWTAHFAALEQHLPTVKASVSPGAPFGIGLRLSDIASRELAADDNLSGFSQWLRAHDCYVFTMNGFPFGGFHHTVVKDRVHSPDWTSDERVAYTLRMFRLLSALLPPGEEGGISTSPLSYRHWHADPEAVFRKSTSNILRVVSGLIAFREEKGQRLHLDIEPEPDGLLETGPEFIEWYEGVLIPAAQQFFKDERGWNAAQSAAAVREHVQLCYDVCHFAVGYEDHERVIDDLADRGIRVGKIQISAALRGKLDAGSDDVVKAFGALDEPTYLHQVVARQRDGKLLRYRDLGDALAARGDRATTAEWRAHFHVPIFVSDFGRLQSTQGDIETVMRLLARRGFTRHLEVETYTWEVLPQPLKLPLAESIVRELQWASGLINESLLNR